MRFFLGRLWSLVVNRLGSESISHNFLHEHYLHFDDLGGFSKREGHLLNIVWLFGLDSLG